MKGRRSAWEEEEADPASSQGAEKWREKGEEDFELGIDDYVRRVVSATIEAGLRAQEESNPAQFLLLLSHSVLTK